MLWRRGRYFLRLASHAAHFHTWIFTPENLRFYNPANAA
jgi:hypothetical protein